MAMTGNCHCGKTAFRVDMERPAQLTRFTCSFRAKRAPPAYCEPDPFKATFRPNDDAIYRWQTRQVAHHFCAHRGCAIYSDSPAFEPDGNWDGVIRRVGVNGRLRDYFDAEQVQVIVVDGKNLW